MLDFIFKGIVWVLAIYGLIELIKTIIYTYTYTNLKSNGIYIIVAVKNQANQKEGFIRTTLFRIIYGKEENIKNYEKYSKEKIDTNELDRNIGIWGNIDQSYINYMRKIGIYK